ncbi:MAG: thiamine phosphate synthase [Geopsychrobacter sp.]|nr:thiamine phosphate synthase [Geopsychrobacter sp.]
MRKPQDNLSALYLITDRKTTTPDLLTTLDAALLAGVRLIQLREKDLPAPELKTLALKILQRTRYFGAQLLLNGSVEIAAEIGADGVQLGVKSCGVAAAKYALGDDALIGYSAHSIHEAEEAADQGADFITFSPIFFTASKAQYGPPQGLNALKEICLNSPIPVYALGGINAARINEVLDAGAYGIALISAIMAAADPTKASRTLLQQIEKSSAIVERRPLID